MTTIEATIAKETARAARLFNNAARRVERELPKIAAGTVKPTDVFKMIRNLDRRQDDPHIAGDVELRDEVYNRIKGLRQAVEGLRADYAEARKHIMLARCDEILLSSRPVARDWRTL